MHYREHEPPAPLRPFVRCLWTLDDPDPRRDRPAEPVVPDGSMELVFHLGDPFRRPGAGVQPRALVAGQITGPLVLQPTGRVHVVGVRFHPAGAAAFVREPLDRIAGATPALEHFWGREAEGLLDRLAAARDRRARLALLGAALLERLDGLRAPPWVEGAVRAIEAWRGRIGIEELAGAAGVSRRTLERGFRAHVGAGPKLLCRIARFQRALRLLGVAPAGGGAAVALECGYADQAHLVREFHALAGAPPGRFLGGENRLAELIAGSAGPPAPFSDLRPPC
jgi:AraC-like DNA-binding protein